MLDCIIIAYKFHLKTTELFSHSCCNILHSKKQCRDDPTFLHPHLHLALLLLKRLLSLEGVYWYLTVFLVCFYPMTTGVENCLYLWFTCTLSSVKCLFISFAYFLIGLFFHPFNRMKTCAFTEHKLLIFMWSNLWIIPLWAMFWCQSKIVLHTSRTENFSYVFFLSFII